MEGANEAARHWGGESPWGLPLFIVTMILAPVIMGGGKRLFDGFSRSLELEQLGVRQSTFATFVDYAVKRS